MRRLILIFAFIVIPKLWLFAQNKTMVVGTMVTRPNAILVLNPPDGDQGFLLPQLTTSQRVALTPSSQEDGLIVFDTGDKFFYYWKNNAWVKGLGDENLNQTLTYDPATQILSLANGGQANLSALKEIPSLTGNAGKFLTNDGTTLSWITVSSIGDITRVIAGQGLSGGGDTGDINLAVNTDGTTISVNGANALQVADNAITNSKLSNDAVNSSKIANATILEEDVADDAISSSKLADGAVTNAKLGVNAVGPSNIQSGGNDKVLVTEPGGVVAWVDKSTLNDDNQNLSLVANTLSIEDGNNVDLSTLTAAGQIAGPVGNLVIQNDVVTSAHITDDAVGAAELADNSVDQNAVQINAITSAQLADNAVDAAAIQPGVVNTTHLNSGGNDKVLTTNAGGTVTWADRTTFVDDNQNLSLAGNTLNIEDGAGVSLNNVVAAGQVAGPLNNLAVQPSVITDVELADNAVDAASIQSGVINETHIASSGNDKVLTTTSGGVVFWADRSTFTDNQNLGLTGNNLNIDDGTGVDLNLLTAAGQVAGALNNLTIQPDVITDVQLADNAVDANAIQPGVIGTTHLASGGSDKVLTTTPGGVVTWADRTDFDDNQNLGLTGNLLNIEDGTGVDLNNLSVNGQVTGTLNNLAIETNAVTDVELADNAVDANAIQPGVVNTTHVTSGGNSKVLTTTAGGTVAWADRSTFTDGQNLSLTGNTVNITGGTGVDLNAVTASGQVAGALNNLAVQNDAITSVHIADDAVGATEIAADAVGATEIVTDAVGASELANNAVDAGAIQSGVVNTSHIASGGNDKVLITNGGGAVSWADRSTFTDGQNLSLAGNTINITGGTGVDLNAVTASGQVAGALNNLTVQNNAITSVHIADDAVGATEIVADAVGSAEIATDAVGASELANNAVDGAAIQSGVVATTHLVSGGNDKVLTTTPGGVVAWADRSTFTDGQNLSLTGNTVNITGGTGVDLNAVTAAGQVAGALNNLAVQNNAITSAHIADDAVGATEIATDAVGASELANNAVDGAAIQTGAVGTTHIASGGNDKVLTTTGAGAVTWADRSSFTDAQNLSLTGNTLNISGGTGVSLNGVTHTGDVTGTINASTVAKIQGRDVANTAPNTNDLLMWNGTAWVPQAVSVTAPTVQYYAIDPANFVGLEPTNGNNQTTLGLYQDDNTFVAANGDGRQIMAPVNLPHGATINRITVYYSDLDVLGDFTIAFYRKSFALGTNDNIAQRSTLLVTLGIANFDLPAIAGAARVVDNSTYTYRIHVTFTAAGNGPALLDQRLYGIRIEYTK